MPIYEYVCQSCQHRFEVKQSFSDPPVSACPQCGQAVTKVISAPAIMFKGSGWYVTDYSDKLKPGAETTEGETKAPEQKKDGDSSAGAPASPATPASGSSTAPASPPAAAGSNPSSTTPATPPSSSSK